MGKASVEEIVAEPIKEVVGGRVGKKSMDRLLSWVVTSLVYVC